MCATVRWQQGEPMGREPPKIRRLAVLIRDGWKCQYCGEPCNAIDHVDPWSHSLDHSLDNLVAACTQCNSIASDKKFYTFLDKKKFILKRREELSQERSGRFCPEACQAVAWCRKHKVCWLEISDKV